MERTWTPLRALIRDLERPPVAGIRRRCIALTVDMAYVLVAIVLLQLALRPYSPLWPLKALDSASIHRWLLLTVTLPFVFYFTVSAASPNGATFGMRLLRIRVRSVEGAEVPYARALLRSLVLLIPFELNQIVLLYPRPISDDPQPALRLGFVGVSVLVLLYLTVVLRSPLRQGPHDLIASTIVEVAPNARE